VSAFDRIVIVDWSANATPKLGADSIWICDRTTAPGGRSRFWNLPTRRAAQRHLEALFRAALNKGERVLAGFDFPFGFPGGFARALGLAGTPWHATWRLLAELVEDDEQNRNNRFAVAALLNRRLSGEAFPFWGCPERAAGRFLSPRKPKRGYGDGLAEHRFTDRLFRGPKPVWKIFTTGSVGGQALTGIPIVHALRHAAALGEWTRVWPFETGVSGNSMAPKPALMLAEVYPSMIAARARSSDVKDRAQVRMLARHFAALDHEGALLPLLRAPAALPLAARRAVLEEEGWILGATGAAMPAPAG
jgi:hypothetical protein